MKQNHTNFLSLSVHERINLKTYTLSGYKIKTIADEFYIEWRRKYHPECLTEPYKHYILFSHKEY